MITIQKAVIGLAATVALLLAVAVIAGTMLGPQPGRGPLDEPQILEPM